MRDVCVYGGGTLNTVARLKRLASWEGSGPGVCFQRGDAGLRFFFVFLSVNTASTNFKLCPTLVPKRVLITCEQNKNSVFLFCYFDNLYQERLFIWSLNSSAQDSLFQFGTRTLM